MEELMMNQKVTLKGFSQESRLNGKEGVIEGVYGLAKECAIVRFASEFSTGARCAVIPFSCLTFD